MFAKLVVLAAVAVSAVNAESLRAENAGEASALNKHDLQRSVFFSIDNTIDRKTYHGRSDDTPSVPHHFHSRAVLQRNGTK
jgi:hypothetical protein